VASLVFLALRGLLRSPARTALVLAGLSVTGALLLDMSMLAGGLQASLGAVLSRLGFAVRVVPRGTLPFSGDVEIPDGVALARAIAARPGVAAAIPVVGTNLYVRAGTRLVPSFALGVPGGGSGAYAVLWGRDLPPGGSSPESGPVPVVVNRLMETLDGVRVGETLLLARSAGPAPAAGGAPEVARVVGVGDFFFDLAAQRSLAIDLRDLRRIQGRPVGGASLILVRMSDPARAEELVRWIDAHAEGADALSIRGFLARAGSRLTYFTQFSLILGTTSLLVSFLLITAIVTLSLGERLGEIAVLRAVGMTRRRIAALVLLEGVALSLASLPGAFSLGLLIGRDLDALLRSAPAVPENLHFFTLTPVAALRTVLLVLGTGTLAGVYPGWVAARLGVAATLHGEVLT
jgi:putative ABC transport system permease protein